MAINTRFVRSTPLTKILPLVAFTAALVIVEPAVAKTSQAKVAKKTSPRAPNGLTPVVKSRTCIASRRCSSVKYVEYSPSSRLGPLATAQFHSVPQTVRCSKAASKSQKKGKSSTAKGSKKQKAAKKRPVERRVAAMKGNQPNVQAQCALVMDLETGQELFARKPDSPRAIASLSKLAAVLVVLDRGLDLEGLTTMKKVDSEVARGGAKSRLLEGMVLSNRDLLHAAMLGSDNRAVSALGRAVGLGAGQLTEAMNRKVASLGLRHTRFREPTGLSQENQSTPRETIQLLKAAMAHPILGPILTRQEYNAHPVSRPPIKYISTHRPALRSNLRDLGGKTGYNDAARYCLVFAAEITGRKYGMAFLGTEGELTRFGDVARVSDWIVSHKPKNTGSTAIIGPPPPAAILGTPDAGLPDAQEVVN